MHINHEIRQEITEFLSCIPNPQMRDDFIDLAEQYTGVSFQALRDNKVHLEPNNTLIKDFSRLFDVMFEKLKLEKIRKDFHNLAVQYFSDYCFMSPFPPPK